MDLILWVVIIAILASIAWVIIKQLDLPPGTTKIIWLVMLLVFVVVVLGPLFGVSTRPVLIR